MQMLIIKNLHAGYGDVPVLWGVDLEVERGEIACLVGSSPEKASITIIINIPARPNSAYSGAMLIPHGP